jgi:hypothetical protein
LGSWTKSARSWPKTELHARHTTACHVLVETPEGETRIPDMATRREPHLCRHLLPLSHAPAPAQDGRRVPSPFPPLPLIPCPSLSSSCRMDEHYHGSRRVELRTTAAVPPTLSSLASHSNHHRLRSVMLPPRACSPKLQGTSARHRHGRSAELQGHWHPHASMFPSSLPPSL